MAATSPRRAPTAALLTVLVTACGPAGSDQLAVDASSISAATTPSASCDDSEAERRRLDGLVFEGKLHRALRVLERANELCPEHAPASWSLEMALLIQLGSKEQVRALAARIEASRRASSESRRAAKRALAQVEQWPQSGAPPPAAQSALEEGLAAQSAGDLGRARERFLRAWELGRDGRALIWAGRLALQQGQPNDARSLFDRGIAQLERQAEEKATLKPPSDLGGEIRSIAWHDSVVAVAHGRVISLLQAATLEETARLEGHSQDVTSVAFSPDGGTLASGARDQTVRLWSTTTARPLARARMAHLGRPFTKMQASWDNASTVAVAFSPDGKMLASGSWDQTVRLWEVATGRALRVLPHREELVCDVAFSPDGSMLASGSQRTAHLWNVATGAQISTWSIHEGWTNALAFSPRGDTLATTSEDGSVALWDVQSGRELWRASIDTPRTADLSFSGDGSTIAVSTQGIELLDAASGASLSVMNDRSLGSTTAVALSDDGKAVIAGTTFGDVSRWDVVSGAQVARLEPVEGYGERYEVTSAVFSPSGDVIAYAAGADVRLWNIASGLRLIEQRDIFEEVNGLAFSADGQLVATAARDGVVRVWKPASGELSAVLMGHRSDVSSVAFSSRTGLLASGSWDKTVKVWDVTTATEVRSLEGHASGVAAVAISPTTEILASASEDSTVRLWKLPSGEPIGQLDLRLRIDALTFSPDGKTLATGAADHSVRLWDLSTLKPGVQLEAPAELQSPRASDWVQQHGGIVDAVAFSLDGRVLASASKDDTVALWSTHDGKRLAVLRDFASTPSSLAFSPDGRLLAVAMSADGVALHQASGPYARLATLGTLSGADFVSTPDGFLEMAPGPHADAVLRLSACRVGPWAFPLEVCAERFLAKNLLARALDGRGSYRLP